MTEFIVNQGDTIIVNFVIPGVDLTFKEVYFKFGDKRNYSKRIKCIRQSIPSENYTPVCKGGVAIPFSDLDRAGFFSAQFELISKDGAKITYPQEGYLKVEVQRSV